MHQPIMLKLKNISEYLQPSTPALLLDARSEGEFEQGHIPGAISFPILNNEERKLVGTCYKKQGHREAVKLGYQLIGPKFSEIISEAYKRFDGHDIHVNCWRGGLRSQIMGSLLQSAGFKVSVLQGGYKTYRNLVLNYLSGDFSFEVLGGLTGSGKTTILHELENRGGQILDIEGLANHKGSAFGALGMQKQPSQEQFENLLYQKLISLDPSKVIWIEDESRLIGTLQVPTQIYLGIRNGFVHFLDYAFEERKLQIIKEYGCFEAPVLAQITEKIRKRMGDLNNRLAVDAIKIGNKEDWADLVLSHYDKQYLYGFSQRNPLRSRQINLNGDALFADLLSQQSNNFSS